MIKIIGNGAAGNKAAIECIEGRVTKKENVLLINSTSKDIPKEYENVSIIIGDGKGAGKERPVGKNYTMSFLKNKSDRLEDFVKDEEVVYIISSTEGGTGSGGTPPIASYIKNVLGVHPHVIAIKGFEIDVKSMKNTLNFFKEMSEDYTIQIIDNAIFEESSNTQRELAANKEICNRLKVLSGLTRVDSDQNIDDADLFKLNVTPGLLSVEYGVLDKIKNKDEYNKLVSSMLDNTKTLHSTKRNPERIGLIVNTKNRDIVDYNNTAIDDRLGGTQKEFYLHLQSIDKPNMKDYINIISCGMYLPLDEMQDSYERLKARDVEREKESFFQSINELHVEDEVFGVTKAKKSKDSFFNGFEDTTFKNSSEDNKSKKKDEFFKKESGKY